MAFLCQRFAQTVAIMSEHGNVILLNYGIANVNVPDRNPAMEFTQTRRAILIAQTHAPPNLKQVMPRKGPRLFTASSVIKRKLFDPSAGRRFVKIRMSSKGYAARYFVCSVSNIFGKNDLNFRTRSESPFNSRAAAGISWSLISCHGRVSSFSASF